MASIGGRGDSEREPPMEGLGRDLMPAFYLVVEKRGKTSTIDLCQLKRLDLNPFSLKSTFSICYVVCCVLFGSRLAVST